MCTYRARLIYTICVVSACRVIIECLLYFIFKKHIHIPDVRSCSCQFKRRCMQRIRRLESLTESMARLPDNITCIVRRVNHIFGLHAFLRTRVVDCPRRWLLCAVSPEPRARRCYCIHGQCRRFCARAIRCLSIVRVAQHDHSIRKFLHGDVVYNDVCVVVCW